MGKDKYFSVFIKSVYVMYIFSCVALPFESIRKKIGK